MTLKASSLISRNFIKALKSIHKHEYRFYTFAGGRGSLKSSFISLAIIMLIIYFRFVNVLVLRKVSNTLLDSVYAQLQWAIGMLEVDDYFKCTTSPMKIVYTPTGQTILFRGVDKPSKIKSIKLKTGYFAVCWYEESTEFTPEEIRSVNQSVMRGGGKNALFWFFDSFNPPIHRDNWKNKEIQIPKENRFVHYSTIYDAPVEWVGSAAIEEAEYLKETNPRLWANEIMGECTGSGLNVFENLKNIELTDEQIGKFDYFFHGVDWGYFPDPWAYNGMAYNFGKRELYIFDELEFYKKGNDATSKELLEYLQKGNYRWYTNVKPESPAETCIKLTPDSAEPKSIADYRSYGWNCHEPKKTGLRDYGFKWLQSLTAIYIDKKRCPKTWEEFYNYEHEINKNGEIISTYPEGQADHHIACVRYALEEVYTKRGY